MNSKTSNFLRLFVDKTSVYARGELYKGVLEPHLCQVFEARPPKVSKTGGAMVLSFKFNNPQSASLAEKRFEILKIRGDPFLKGVSKKFARRRPAKLPEHLLITTKRPVGRPPK